MNIIFSEVVRNVYVDRPVPVPVVKKVVEHVPVAVDAGIKGIAYQSFAGSLQQKLDDYKSSS